MHKASDWNRNAELVLNVYSMALEHNRTNRDRISRVSVK
jgi:hypothetical protein